MSVDSADNVDFEHESAISPIDYRRLSPLVSPVGVDSVVYGLSTHSLRSLISSLFERVYIVYRVYRLLEKGVALVGEGIARLAEAVAIIRHVAREGWPDEASDWWLVLRKGHSNPSGVDARRNHRAEDLLENLDRECGDLAERYLKRLEER